MGYAICKMCKMPLSSHTDEDLNRCFKMEKLAEWRKGEPDEQTSGITAA